MDQFRRKFDYSLQDCKVIEEKVFGGYFEVLGKRGISVGSSSGVDAHSYDHFRPQKLVDRRRARTGYCY